jgi:hypothetical protein
MKKNQIRGTHNAAETLGSRAGSNQKRAEIETSHIDRTKEGGIMIDGPDELLPLHSD